jgi:hypothetical protein
MKTHKPKAAEPSLLDQLNKPLRDFVNDFKIHGTSTLEKLRDESPSKYLELSVKLLGLVAALNPRAVGFEECQTVEEVGRRLLAQVGANELAVTSEMAEAAIRAQDDFAMALAKIVEDGTN